MGSYIDGIVAAAALPPRVRVRDQERDGSSAARKSAATALGSALVERFDRHKGGADARRVWKLAAEGQSLVFFPEGTLNATRQVRKFLGGAFVTAARSNMPIVAAAIHGTRDVLPSAG